MDTGKQINDKFYKGYEGEEEIVFSTDSNHESPHVWGGYLDDLKQYCGRQFSFEETGDCLSVIISFLENAEQQSCKVTMCVM